MTEKEWKMNIHGVETERKIYTASFQSNGREEGGRGDFLPREILTVIFFGLVASFSWEAGG